MRRIPSPLAVAALIPFLAQATGAASLPALVIAPPGAFAPPPARSAPRAAAAKKAAPSGPSWLDSARVVLDYLAEEARAALNPPAPAPAPRAVPPPLPAEEPAPMIVAPPAEAPKDRMLVSMEPGVRIVGIIGRGDVDFSQPPAPALAFSAKSLPPFREKWIEQSGVRARLTYLHPHGTVHGAPDGYTAVFAGGETRRVAGDLPPAYRRDFPIYWHGEQVEVEMELVNGTDRTLRGLRVESVQESFRPVGTEGMRLSPPADVRARDLPPGARAVVRWWVRLEGPGHAAVNLEQTHVRVSAGPRDAAAPLIDAPQAGVIDPPGPGLL